MTRSILNRILFISLCSTLLLAICMVAGIALGPSKISLDSLLKVFFDDAADPILKSIIWDIRLPRVWLAFFVGGALSLGGLVFQAILRNPLAEPYILGISGGAGVGAIIGILLGFSTFPGLNTTSFLGGMGTLFLVLYLTTGKSILTSDSLLLAGVMVNAFCSAIILFLVSMSQSGQITSIIHWMFGNLSLAQPGQVGLLSLLLIPCFLAVFSLSHVLNLLLLGEESAQALGVSIKTATFGLLILTSFMISTAVCYTGLLGFVGLVIPHILRLTLGPDHRVLVPSCILVGGSYLILCDLLSRTLPEQGEIPVGVITAVIGAPLFIFLLRRMKQ